METLGNPCDWTKFYQPSPVSVVVDREKDPHCKGHRECRDT